MKIALPFELGEIFSPRQIELLESLGLSLEELINLVLLHWNTYSLGAAQEIYERTIDDLFDVFQDKYGQSDEWHRRQHVLSQCADQVVEAITQLAHYLHRLMDAYPDEHMRKSHHTDDYHFLKVWKIDLRGKTLILTSDVIDG